MASRGGGSDFHVNGKPSQQRWKPLPAPPHLSHTYLPLPAVVTEHSTPLLLSRGVSFHLTTSVYFSFLLLLSVALSEWSRWTVSSTSSAGVAGRS